MPIIWIRRGTYNIRSIMLVIRIHNNYFKSYIFYTIIFMIFMGYEFNPADDYNMVDIVSLLCILSKRFGAKRWLN